MRKLPGIWAGFTKKMRWTICVAILAFARICHCETLVTPAKISEVTERGLVLMIGTEAVVVEDTSETKWWRACTLAKKESFRPGDTVQVRIKTDADPPALKEIADADTWKWLDSVRKEFRPATIEKIDSRMLHVKFDDGTKFSYRFTEKSGLELKDKQSATGNDLSAGMRIYIKGRLLPNLDTWVFMITDTPPPPNERKTSAGSAKPPKGTAIKEKPLPDSGKLEGRMVTHLPNLRMFDILVEPKSFHITYDRDTKFYVDKKLMDPSVLRTGQVVVVTYKRDKYGRLLSSKVEIFTKG